MVGRIRRRHWRWALLPCHSTRFELFVTPFYRVQGAFFGLLKLTKFCWGIGQFSSFNSVMNTTSLPTQTSVASWPSLNGGVSMRSPATFIVPAAAVKRESRSFWATARTWLLDLFTAPSVRDVEPRCPPSVDFTPTGPLVYQWQIDRSTAQDRLDLC